METDFIFKKIMKTVYKWKKKHKMDPRPVRMGGFGWADDRYTEPATAVAQNYCSYCAKSATNSATSVQPNKLPRGRAPPCAPTPILATYPHPIRRLLRPRGQLGSRMRAPENEPKSRSAGLRKSHRGSAGMDPNVHLNFFSLQIGPSFELGWTTKRGPYQ